MRKKEFYTLYRYVLSYLLAAVIPLSAIMLLSYHFFVRAYRLEVEENRAYSLGIVHNSVEMMLSQMENIVRQLQMEEDLRYDVQTDFVSAVRLQNRLHKYTNTTNFLRDTMVYLHGNEYICAASSTYSMHTYGELVNRMAGVEPEVFYGYLNNPEQRVVLSSTEEHSLGNAPSEVITFLYPLPYLETYSYATVIFKIEPGAIRRLFTDSGDDNYAIVIQTPGDEVIVSSRPEMDEIVRRLLDEAEIGGAGGSFLHTAEGVEYMTTYTRNTAGDILYLNMIPTDTAMWKVRQVQQVFIAIILGLILLEGSILLAVAYRNYRPIRSLQNYIKVNYSLPEQKRGFMIQTAEHVLADMATTHQRLNEALVANQDSLREVLLYKMINGGFTGTEELAELHAQAGIRITKPCLRVAIATADSLDGPLRNMLLETLAQQLPTAQIYSCVLSDLLVLVMADDKAPQAKYSQRFRAVEEAILRDPDREIRIGVGDVCLDISKLHQSYIQASSALDYRLGPAEQRVVFYSDILSDKDIFGDYPSMELERVHTAILENDGDRFSAMVRQLMRMLEERRYNLTFVKLVTYDIVNTIIKASLASGRGVSRIHSKAPDIIYLSATHSFHELLAIVSTVSEEVGRFLGESSGDNNLMERVTRAINENAYRYDFSIKQLASQFKMSQNNLSQQFKRYTGQTPTEYINYLRMNKTKYYLLKTDLTLKQIAELVGYVNESSFIRKFKDEVGVTPGEYRKRFGA